MSDYIKREAAIKALDDIKNINEDSWLCARYTLKHNVPTADVVEVVRCKDCKWRYSTSDCTHWLPCMDIIYNHDFYCSYGERADA